jgi:hypothetical protein
MLEYHIRLWAIAKCVLILSVSARLQAEARLTEIKGRAIAEAASRRVPTAAARVRARSGHVGFVVDKVALGQVFSVYFDFPCQSSFHKIVHPHNHPEQVQ